MAKKKDSAADKKLIEKALDDYKLCTDLNAFIEADAIEDLKFSVGEQWPADIIKERTDDGRPSLVVNKLPTFIAQVTNEQRMNRPTIKTRPVDDVTDPETAKVINGLVRHIQSYSNADHAYDTAFEYACTCGFGFFRILTDYCDPASFDQEILIKRIDDPLSVRFPFHLCKEADYSDAPFAFVEQLIPRKQFEDKYPNVDIKNWDSKEQRSLTWITDEHVRVAEYWKVEEEEKTLYLIVDEQGNQIVTAELPDGVEPIKERSVTVKNVKWYLMTAADIIDRGEFPSEYVPIIPVLGKEVVSEGRKYFISLVRNAKDPQRMLNYWKSAECETIALAPKAPYIVAAGQLEGYESQWNQANRKNITYLEYNPVDKAGNPVPAPQRAIPAQLNTAIVNAINEANDDIKATTGIYDASLGAKGNETSGKAIKARQHEGDVANFHFIDNLNRSIRFAGKIIVDLIPKIYDTARTVRIIGEDQKESVVKVNQQYADESGKTVLYDVRAGRYDVIVDVGPSYTTKREEAADALQGLLQAVPMIGQVAPDLILKAFDFTDAETIKNIADRAKRALPPQLLSPKEQAQMAAEQQAAGMQQPPQGEDPMEVAALVGDFRNLQAENEAMRNELGKIDLESVKMNREDVHKENEMKLRAAEMQLRANTELEKARISAASRPDKANRETKA